MSKIIISELDRRINRSTVLCFDTAMRRIQKYIVKNIDETFPSKEFSDWCNSDTDKPFVWNKNRYHWS